MSLAEYEEFVFRAGLLDRDDPVAAWREFGDRLAAARRAGSTTCRELRVVAEGTDLTLGVEGRTWIPADGNENFPDGEVFTGPVETSVEGDDPLQLPGVFHGRVVEGVELRFEGGEVVEAEAPHGARSSCSEMLAMDDGRAAGRRVRLRHERGDHRVHAATRSSTRRSAAPSTSRSARPIRRAAA